MMRSVLDGAIVESNVVIEAGRNRVPEVHPGAGVRFTRGCPAKPVRELRLGENALSAPSICGRPLQRPSSQTAIEKPSTSVGAALSRPASSPAMRASPDTWRCAAARAYSSRAALMRPGPRSSSGRNTNIQDNTSIQCSADGIIIGDDTTVGHNVRIHDSRIGSPGSLIGIGAVVSSGSIVEDDVLVAAGAVTSPYQILERGFVWGGRPAGRLRSWTAPNVA
ncbi:MAG: hypothetical protein WDN31_04005 [Hyphomicrobium sp.]